MSIAGRITKLENGNPASGEVEPIIISWPDDPEDPNNWACALVGHNPAQTVIKPHGETKTAFAARVIADAQTRKAGS